MTGKVPTDALVAAGLQLMRQAGHPLERVKTNGRAMVYRTEDGQTVRLRTSNDPVLVVGADSTDPDDARLNIEGTDYLLLVMPEQQRTPGPVAAYFLPVGVAADAVRSDHKAWLATNPNTKGENRTWSLWFANSGPKGAKDYTEQWSQYRLKGSATAGRVWQEAPKASLEVTKLGDVIAAAKMQIAEAAGVPIESVKITLDI
jgi:hypothetical protein